MAQYEAFIHAYFELFAIAAIELAAWGSPEISAQMAVAIAIICYVIALAIPILVVLKVLEDWELLAFIAVIWVGFTFGMIGWESYIDSLDVYLKANYPIQLYPNLYKVTS